MDIYTFASEYDNLSTNRKVEYVSKIFDFILKEIKNGDSPIFEEDFLSILVEAESNDYFGTEGFRE